MDFCVRPYMEADAERIGSFNREFETAYRYNQDLDKGNIFCAISQGGDMAGCGHLEYHDTWWSIKSEKNRPDFVHKIQIHISIKDAVSDDETKNALASMLLDTLIQRGKDIRSQYPDKNVRLIDWLNPATTVDINDYIRRGFHISGNSLAMKRDLSEPVPTHKAPEGITVQPYPKDCIDGLTRYHAAETEGFNGINRGFNTFMWSTDAPEWTAFAALFEGNVVGGVTTYKGEGNQSCTEDIFVVPKWRNQGVAKGVIASALRYLQDQGKDAALLSVRGDNITAMNLYYSLGYRVFRSFLEFGKDI